MSKFGKSSKGIINTYNNYCKKLKRIAKLSSGSNFYVNTKDAFICCLIKSQYHSYNKLIIKFTEFEIKKATYKDFDNDREVDLSYLDIDGICEYIQDL